MKKHCEEEIKRIVNEIKKFSNEAGVCVAFSGGLDSSVVAALAVKALGKEKVELVTTKFAFTYPKTLEVVEEFSRWLGVKHSFVDATQWQERIWKGGPSCNACTRGPKLSSVKTYAKGRLVLTGAEGGDTWGKMGLKVYNGFYSPLFSLEREKVEQIADCLNLKIRKIGENAAREGCILKHLLKMMAVLSFHGRAVYESNLALMSFLKKEKMTVEIANVKIIGPLSENVALVNIKPIPSNDIKMKIKEKISKISVISKVEIVDRPIVLTLVANPGLYNNERSRYWTEKGRIAPDFAATVSLEWRISRNKRLKTFSVVSYRFLNS